MVWFFDRGNGKSAQRRSSIFVFQESAMSWNPRYDRNREPAEVGFVQRFHIDR